MSVFVMRGIPYGGKNWWIKNKLRAKSTLKIFSPMDYFRDEIREALDASSVDQRVADGIKNIGEMVDARADCLLRFLDALYEQGNKPARNLYTTFVVNDTNIALEDFSPYYAAADAYEHNVKVVTVSCEPSSVAWTRYNRHADKSLNLLTPYDLEDMAVRMRTTQVPEHMERLVVYNNYLPRRESR